MTTSADDMDALRDAVRREIEDLSEDMLRTEKTHFAHAATHARTNMWLGLSSTVAAAIAAATVIAEITPLVPGISALVAAITSGLLTFLKPRDAEARHLNAARQLNALRVQIRQALRVDLARALEPDPKSWRELVAKFAEERAKVDQASPGTSDPAFGQARAKIEAGHFQHESDS